jgi:hypothetical protein
MLREGSFALASFGKFRNVHETAFPVAFGRKSVAVKRIFTTDLAAGFLDVLIIVISPSRKIIHQ